MIRRAWLGLVLALGLGSCAPAIVGTVTPPVVVVDPGGATLKLDVQGAVQVVSFAAGTQLASGVTLTLTGGPLAVNDSHCIAQGQQLVCQLGDVPAGKTYVLPARGVTGVQAGYWLQNGAGYTLTAR